jgi:hypothetical protein
MRASSSDNGFIGLQSAIHAQKVNLCKRTEMG